MRQLLDKAIIRRLLENLRGLLTQPHLMHQRLITTPQPLQDTVTLPERGDNQRPKRLLRKQIHERLLAARALYRAGLCGADAPAQCERHGPRVPGGVALDGDETREAGAGEVASADGGADHAGGDHGDVVAVGGDGQVVVEDVVA